MDQEYDIYYRNIRTGRNQMSTGVRREFQRDGFQQRTGKEEKFPGVEEMMLWKLPLPLR